MTCLSTKTLSIIIFISAVYVAYHLPQFWPYSIIHSNKYTLSAHTSTTYTLSNSLGDVMCHPTPNTDDNVVSHKTIFIENLNITNCSFDIVELIKFTPPYDLTVRVAIVPLFFAYILFGNLF